MLYASRTVVLVFLIGLLFFTTGATPPPIPAPVYPTQNLTSAQGTPTDQLIVKYKGNLTALSDSQKEGRMRVLSNRSGVQISYVRPMSMGAHVVRLPERLPVSEVEQIAAKIMTGSDILYAEPDYIMHPTLTPNDTSYALQWHYQEVTGSNYGANLPGAWDVTTGNAGIIMAVLDTGILADHPDLVGRTVPGYDFITNPFMANDGGGRDADPSDPGDWVTVNESVFICGVPASNSSWHGTHVAGTMGAASNNGTGVAGINWVSPILPVRVLGKCGGTTSDIADGMLWAAGIAVAGVPANANPAKVLNLSLGGTAPCSTTYQTAIDQIITAGAILVVAAGNSNVDVANASPGNCDSVITVAATGHTGSKASYSNFGSLVEISGPGGDQSTFGPSFGVLSTLNSGTTSPVTHNYVYYQGTSMAAPHVAGIISLMLSVDATLTQLQILSILQNTVTPFPAGSTCTTSICGVGIINAAGAVIGAQTPPTIIKTYLPLAIKS